MLVLISKVKNLVVTIVGGVLVVSFLLCDKSPTEPDRNLYNIRITELHYNPADTAEYISDSLEFIELRNCGSIAMDIGTLEFTKGISYTFPNDAQLNPDSFYVIASNRNAFKFRYGYYPDGVYSGQLRNSADTLELDDRLTETELLVQMYADANGWPEDADGKGYSLVPYKKISDRNQNNPAAWRRSLHKNGSPGKPDS